MKAYLIPFAGALVGAIDTFLKVLGYLPPFIALSVLILTAVITLPLVWKNSKKVKRWFITAICGFVFIGLAVYFFNDREKADKPLASTIQQDKISTNSTSTTTTTKQAAEGNNNQMAGGHSTQIMVSAPVTADHLQIGNGNTMNVNVYKRPPQRHVNIADLKKLNSIPSVSRINLLCPPNNNEAAEFAAEIRNTLFDLGHRWIAAGIAEKSSNASKDRFSITPIDQQEQAITIFVNPQF